MATFIPHADLAKLLGSQTLESDASTVRALIEEVKARIAPEEWKQALRAAILVNGVGIHRLKGLDTPLGPDDKVWMVLPSGGG
jgi:molybdopterin converting factor small subunit